MQKPANSDRIAYRETIRRTVIGERKYIRYFDRRGHFAHVRLELVPRPGQPPAISRADDLPLSDACYHAARAALFRKLEQGPLRRCPMTALEARLLAATYLERFSYPEAVAQAACMAFDDAVFRADPTILEPWIGIRLSKSAVFRAAKTVRTHRCIIMKANFRRAWGRWLIDRPVQSRMGRHSQSCDAAFGQACCDRTFPWYPV